MALPLSILSTATTLTKKVPEANTRINKKISKAETLMNNTIKTYNDSVIKINSLLYELERLVNKALYHIMRGVDGAIPWISDKIRKCLEKIDKAIDEVNEYVKEKIDKIVSGINDAIDNIIDKMLAATFAKLGIPKNVRESDEFKGFVDSTIKPILPSFDITKYLPSFELNILSIIPQFGNIFNMDFGSLIDPKNIVPFDIPKLPEVETQELPRLKPELEEETSDETTDISNESEIAIESAEINIDNEESAEQFNDEELLNQNETDYNDTKYFVLTATNYNYYYEGENGIKEIEDYIAVIKSRIEANKYIISEYKTSDEEFIKSLKAVINRMKREKPLVEERRKIDEYTKEFIEAAYNYEKTKEEIQTMLYEVNNRLTDDNYLVDKWRQLDINYFDDLEYLLEDFDNELE